MNNQHEHTFTRITPLGLFLWRVEFFIESPDKGRGWWVTIHDNDSGIPWCDVRPYLPYDIRNQHNHLTSYELDQVKTSLNRPPYPPKGEGFMVSFDNGYRDCVDQFAAQHTFLHWAQCDGYEPQWPPIGRMTCEWCTKFQDNGLVTDDSPFATRAFLVWNQHSADYVIHFLCPTCAHDVTPKEARIHPAPLLSPGPTPRWLWGV